MTCQLVPDINECMYDNGGCTDDCMNTQGSYYCICSPGNTLDDDQTTCKGKRTFLELLYPHNKLLKALNSILNAHNELFDQHNKLCR